MQPYHIHDIWIPFPHPRKTALYYLFHFLNQRRLSEVSWCETDIYWLLVELHEVCQSFRWTLQVSIHVSFCNVINLQSFFFLNLLFFCSADQSQDTNSPVSLKKDVENMEKGEMTSKDFIKEYMWPWTTKPVIRVNFFLIWPRYNYLKIWGCKKI